jgi:DNA-binding beta-propeller fold protein YncE
MRRLVTVVTFAIALSAWQASAALGADSIYWTAGQATGAVRVGNLDGSGTARNLFTGVADPFGLALDPAAAKIYWTTFANGGGCTNVGAIEVGSLDGSGAGHDLFSGEGCVTGLATDSTGGKIYWSDNQTPGPIRAGNLGGSGAHDLYTSNLPEGVAIDPTGGKIYWATDTGTIQVGNLDGTGTPQTLFSASSPAGLAIDPAAGKIYWSSGIGGTGGSILVANLNGTGTPTPLFTGENEPFGLAIDPAAGKIYWADRGSGQVRVGNLDGGTAQDVFSGEDHPTFLALLRSPLGTGAPHVSGGSSVGSTLSCVGASWGADLVGAFLYRAPNNFAFQWSRNGSVIPGATSSSYRTAAAGSYTCRVIASNQAGTGSQASVGFAVSDLLSRVRQSHRRWREGSGLPHIASARPPVGTTFRFTLKQSAQVRFTFKQRLPGRRVNGRCVRPTSSNRGRPKCTRLASRGSLSFSVKAGAHKLRFQGRLSKHKRLPVGRYTMVITATNSAGQHATAKLTFTIVKG